MKRLIRLAVWFYPPRWRQRYAREFDALLDDVEPGVRQLFDVLKGAISMQVRTLGAIPVLCALIGAMVGGLVAFRTPAIYASEALLVVRGDIQNPESFRILNSKLFEVLGQSDKERAATSVNVRKGRGKGLPDTFVKITYRNPDAIQAQRVAANLLAALVSNSPAAWSKVMVLDAPVVPKLPVPPNYWVPVTSGSIFGLVIGGIAVLLLKWSRRQPKAN